MKKRIIPLALALTLTLTGCGLSDQWATVREEYIDPAIERAEGNAASDEGGVVAPNVATDREELTEYVPFEAVYSRLSSSVMDTLATSDSYGRLLPFGGGLVTESGMIVLDPVLESVTAASYESGGETQYLDIYILQNTDGLYAVCGADGSWISDFAYTAVYPMELGVLCVTDENANLAVCYDEAGTQLFNTANFSDRSMMAAGSVSTLAQCGSGLMLCTYQSGSKSFLRADGTALNRSEGRTSYFEDALPFSEGYAAVRVNGLWGYVNTDGEFAVQPAYSQATSFVGGYAAVYGGGMWQIIDTTGTVRLQLPGVSEVSLGYGSIDADGTYYSTQTFEQAVFYGYTGVPIDGGFWVKGETGVRVFLTGGSEVYFSGASSIISRSGDLWLVELADGSQAVMDNYSRVVSYGECSFVQDQATGDTYMYNPGTQTLYDSAGSFVADGCTGVVIDGFAWCSDSVSCGWKNMSNEWIFRVPTGGAD